MSEAPVTITLAENGWYTVEGPVRIVGSDGELIREGEKFFLCRCGQSNSKPFCDGTHKKCGFSDDGLGKRSTKED
ncbi:MAG TPA: iron-binding protein [Actinobacteria bacterium]|nr:iron-binding protein [Actinomycetota bacterium]